MGGSMPKISFIDKNVSIEVAEGTTILEAMREALLQPDAPCGGQGKCGKCLVYLPDTGEEVLACMTKTGTEDINVITKKEEEKSQILTQSVGTEVVFDPFVRKAVITVPPCPLGESISDWTRFKDALMLADPDTEWMLRPDAAVIAKLTGIIKRNNGVVHVVYTGEHIIKISNGDIPFCTAAFDIGTTTVAGYLLDGSSGGLLATCSRLNPQKQFGADVISRSGYALEHGGEELRSCIQKALDEMIGEMTEQTRYSKKDVFAVSVVGNTCMHHLYLGLDVDSLVHAPYNPAVREEMIVPASYCSLDIAERGIVLLLPNIAGFVGADTIGCLVATDLAEQKEWTLLIDIGTNGEMVLGKNHRLAACSTAAGPAFEGVGISMGMRGANGAISKAKYTENGWDLSVIGEEKAVGICGSGLLDIAAEMLRNDLMDENGQMEEQVTVLVPEEESGLEGRAVVITQKDIRELQMAKAAIRAGIELLAAHMGIKVGDIKKVWLAGAFGSFMDHRSACRIGMIPPVLEDRIIPVGNAAGLGAQLVLRNRERWKKAEEFSLTSEFLELAVLPDFQDTFVDALEFA